ncbi:MAG: hypothetical protein IPO90_05835 [Flavobacteriales bacterium]|nr:hypothetical protein [Flavobacteriales bacterium]
MNRIILALLSTVLLAAHASAQQAQMDSVRSLLDHHKAQDAERVRLLCEAARLDAWIDPFDGERVADQAVTLARRLKDPTLVAVSLITKAGLHQNTWARDDQKALIDEAFTLSPTMGSIRERARALSVRDMNESWQGRVGDGRPLQHEALALARKAGDRVQEAWCLYNLGFALLGPDRQASDSLLLLSKRIMDAHGNLGERSFIDMWQGIIQASDGYPAKALGFSEQALAMALAGGSTMSAGNCYVMVGNCKGTWANTLLRSQPTAKRRSSTVPSAIAKGSIWLWAT